MKNKQIIQIFLSLLIALNSFSSPAKDLLGFEKAKENVVPSEYVNTNVAGSSKEEKKENKEDKETNKEAEKKFNSAFEKDLYDRQMRQIKYNQPSPFSPLVFGESLFLGNFAEQRFTASNPDYRISIGDNVF